MNLKRRILATVSAVAVTGTMLAINPLLSLFSSAQTTAPDYRDGLISAYEFNETTGYDYADSAGDKDATSDPNLVPVNPGFRSAAVVDTPHGKGLRLIQCKAPIDGSALKGVTDVTIQMYVKIERRSDSWTNILSIGRAIGQSYIWRIAKSAPTANPPFNRELQFDLNESDLGTATPEASFLDTKSSDDRLINDQGYHLITMTQSGGTVNMYIDGTLTNSKGGFDSYSIDKMFTDKNGKPVNDVLISPLLSLYQNDIAAVGDLDDFRIWNKALTQDQITAEAALYAQPNNDLSGVPADGLIYGFDYNTITSTGVAKNMVNGNPDQNLYLYGADHTAGSLGDGAVSWTSRQGAQRRQIFAPVDYDSLKTKGGMSISMWFKSDRTENDKQFLFEMTPVKELSNTGTGTGAAGRNNYLQGMIVDGGYLKFEVDANGKKDSIQSYSLSFLSDGWHLATFSQSNTGETEIYVDNLLVAQASPSTTDTTVNNNLFNTSATFHQFASTATASGVYFDIGSNCIFSDLSNLTDFDRQYNGEGLLGSIDSFRLYDHALSAEDVASLTSHYSETAGVTPIQQSNLSDILEAPTVGEDGVAAVVDFHAAKPGGYNNGRSRINADGTITCICTNDFIYNFRIPADKQAELVANQANGTQYYFKILYYTEATRNFDSKALAFSGAFGGKAGYPNSGNVLNAAKQDGVWQTAAVKVNLTADNVNTDINLWSSDRDDYVTVSPYFVIADNADPLDAAGYPAPAVYTRETVPQLQSDTLQNGNIIVWDLQRTNTDGSNPNNFNWPRNMDGTTFSRVNNEVVYNGYTDRLTRYYQNPSNIPSGNYYFKMLIKTENSNDPFITKGNGTRYLDKNYVMSVRTLGDQYLGIGSPGLDGVWQSVVVPFDLTDTMARNNEEALYNSWIGGNFKTTFGRYAVISSDPTPLPIPSGWSDSSVSLDKPAYIAGDPIAITYKNIDPSIISGMKIVNSDDSDITGHDYWVDFPDTGRNITVPNGSFTYTFNADGSNNEFATLPAGNYKLRLENKDRSEAMSVAFTVTAAPTTEPTAAPTTAAPTTAAPTTAAPTTAAPTTAAPTTAAPTTAAPTTAAPTTAAPTTAAPTTAAPTTAAPTTAAPTTAAPTTAAPTTATPTTATPTTAAPTTAAPTTATPTTAAPTTVASTATATTASATTSTTTASAAAYTMKGRLLSDGKPVANTVIELHSDVQRATTDANGWFTFKDVEAGSHTMNVLNADNSIAATMTFEIKAANVSSPSLSGSVLSVPSSVSSLSLDLNMDNGSLSISNVKAVSNPTTGDNNYLIFAVVLLGGAAAALAVSKKRRPKSDS